MKIEDTFDLVESYTDIIQIGTRNMQNFSLLKMAGEASRPVLLKRGMAATTEEWLMAAEYIPEGKISQIDFMRNRGPHLYRQQPKHIGPIGFSPYRCSKVVPPVNHRESQSCS